MNWCANVDKLHLINQPASISELQPDKTLRSIASSNLMLAGWLFKCSLYTFAHQFTKKKEAKKKNNNSSKFYK